MDIEQTKEAIKKALREKLEAGEIDLAYLAALVDSGRAARAASEFSEQAFIDFYWCLFNKEPPPYAKKYWIPALVEAYKTHTGVLLDCFRGSTKSTMIFAWALFVTGHNPIGSTVVVRINDDAAAETGNAMAAVIEHHPGWKAVFPHLVPDDKWSSKGYFLKNLNMDYGEWVKLCTTDHLGEPTILVAGSTSGDIIGKHPSNGMYFDDLHNEKNTRSEREMRTIVDVFRSDIIPTWTRPEGHPTLGVACTLWSENDVYHAMMQTGLFKHIKTPIYYLPNETTETEFVSFGGQDVVLAWPEAFPVERVQEIYEKNPIQFPRMYRCDLSAMKGIALKKEWLHYYLSEKIDASWPVYFGIDFASTEDKLRDKDRDYFALAIGRAVPGGGMILIGGFRDKLSTGEALGKVKALAGLYPSLAMIGVEKWGKGEEFKTQLVYSSNLPIIPLPLAGTPVKSKGKKFQDELAPTFMMSRAWVSDIKDDFIEAFEDEWVGWDGGKSRTGHDDTLDAVYLMMLAGQGHLMPAQDSDSLIFERVKMPHPLTGIAAHVGYGVKHGR